MDTASIVRAAQLKCGVANIAERASAVIALARSIFHHIDANETLSGAQEDKVYGEGHGLIGAVVLREWKLLGTLS